MFRIAMFLSLSLLVGVEAVIAAEGENAPPSEQKKPAPQAPAKPQPALTGEQRKAIEKIIAQLDAAPVGIKVTHTPSKVTSVKGPLKGDWKYKWTFQTEFEAIDQPLTVGVMGILAWDGEKWTVDPQKYNSAVMPKEVFADWYSCPGAKLLVGKPVSDKANWAGSQTKAPFKQRWFVLARDQKGKVYKGEQVVEFDVPDVAP